MKWGAWTDQELFFRTYHNPITSIEVTDIEEQGYSSLLDKDGKRIPYEKQKMDYIGFVRWQKQ